MVDLTWGLTQEISGVPFARQGPVLFFSPSTQISPLSQPERLALIFWDTRAGLAQSRTFTVAARPATPDEIVPLLGAKPGSLGAVVNVPASVKVYADERLRGDPAPERDSQRPRSTLVEQRCERYRDHLGYRCA